MTKLKHLENLPTGFETTKVNLFYIHYLLKIFNKNTLVYELISL